MQDVSAAGKLEVPTETDDTSPFAEIEMLNVARPSGVLGSAMSTLFKHARIAGR